MPKRGDDIDTPMRRWFRGIRAIYGLDQDALAQSLGKSRSSVAGYETKTNVPRDVVETILREFPDVAPPRDLDLPPGVERPAANRMLGDATYVEGIPYREVRYAGEVPATSWGAPLSADTFEKLDAKFSGRNRFCTRVIGDSCYPALQPGDLAVWESDRNPPYRVIVLAERDEDAGCTVKQLVYDVASGAPKLKPVNPRYESPPNGNGWRATARLVGLIRKTDGPEKTWYWEPGLKPRDLFDTEPEG